MHLIECDPRIGFLQAVLTAFRAYQLHIGITRLQRRVQVCRHLTNHKTPGENNCCRKRRSPPLGFVWEILVPLSLCINIFLDT